MASHYEWEQLGAEVMDSRSLIAVADEIRDALEALDSDGEEIGLEALESSTGNPADDAATAREILAAIDALADEGIADWLHGEMLIREDYFTTYAKELAHDIGAVDESAGWPGSFIDWERAAEALLQDYQELDYLGTTYYAR